MNNVHDKCPFEPYCSRAPQFSYVRLLHAVPNAPAVDIYLNERLTASNISYRGFTQYLPYLPGNYNIKIFPTGQRINPVINTNVNFPAGSIITTAATGLLQNPSIQLIPDNPIPALPARVYLRLVHLSPNAPAVDMTTPDGVRLFENVSFRGVTSYTAIAPGTYTLQLRLPGTEQIVLNVPNAVFGAGRFYTVYVVGLVGEAPSLQMLLPLDGGSYININRKD